MPWYTLRRSPRCPVESGKGSVRLRGADGAFDLDKFAKIVACYAKVKTKPAYHDESALFMQIDALKTFLDGVFESKSNSREVKGEIRTRIRHLGAAVKGNAIMAADDKFALRQYLNAVYKFTMDNLRMARRQTRRDTHQVRELRRLAEAQERAATRAARRAARNLERAARATRVGLPGRATASRAASPNSPVRAPSPSPVNSPNSPNINLTGGRRKRHSTRKMRGGMGSTPKPGIRNWVKAALTQPFRKREEETVKNRAIKFKIDRNIHNDDY